MTGSRLPTDRLPKRMEDYLRQFAQRRDETGASRILDVAKHAKVSTATVSLAVKQLMESGHVDHKKWQGVRLTPKGRKYADVLVLRYDTLECFALEMLAMPEEQAATFACDAEHYTDDATIDRLKTIIDRVDGCGPNAPGRDSCCIAMAFCPHVRNGRCPGPVPR